MILGGEAASSLPGGTSAFEVVDRHRRSVFPQPLGGGDEPEPHSSRPGHANVGVAEDQGTRSRMGYSFRQRGGTAPRSRRESSRSIGSPADATCPFTKKSPR